MSSYSNLMNSLGGPVLVSNVPRIEVLSIAKPRWYCFLVSYALQVAILGALLAISILAPRIAPHLEAHVNLIAPYLASAAPSLVSVRPVHVVPITPVVKAIMPAPRIEQPVASVELPPPVLHARQPERVRKLAPVPEMAQPKAIPAPRFDSRVLNALPGPKAERIVATNTFGGSSAAPTLQKIAPSKVQTGGFGDPNGVPLNAHGSEQANIAAVGSFDLPGGPGYGNGTGGARGLRGTVASAGFGNGVAVQGGGGHGGNAAQGRVHGTDFSAAAPTTAPEPMRQRHASAVATNSPVSIQSKPTPLYTEEARQLKIEGEVLLNVEFMADGHVRVLNVIRGLGHGLDEAAQRAARGIHFSPAMRDGHPVDSTATLHIIFQLS